MYAPPSPGARAARALRLPSWYTAPARGLRNECSTEPGDTAQQTYLTSFEQPSDDPYEELCRAFNVYGTPFALPPEGTIPSTISMRVRRDAHMPTHGLFILPSHTAPSATPPSPTLTTLFSQRPAQAPALPINVDLFSERFTYDLSRLCADDASAPGSTLPVPFYADSASGFQPRVQYVELPTMTLSLPHPPSVPLLLLFGFGLPLTSAPSSAPSLDIPRLPSRRRSGSSSLDDHTGLLATFLLPSRSIGEFPSVPAMASALLQASDAASSDSDTESGRGSSASTSREVDGELSERTAFVGGLWANVLALGPRDARIVDMVRCAWNVCKEAQRLRDMVGRAHSRGHAYVVDASLGG